jgi:hypothetical protein
MLSTVGWFSRAILGSRDLPEVCTWVGWETLHPPFPSVRPESLGSCASLVCRSVSHIGPSAPLTLCEPPGLLPSMGVTWDGLLVEPWSVGSTQAGTLAGRRCLVLVTGGCSPFCAHMNTHPSFPSSEGQGQEEHPGCGS